MVMDDYDMKAHCGKYDDVINVYKADNIPDIIASFILDKNFNNNLVHTQYKINQKDINAELVINICDTVERLRECLLIFDRTITNIGARICHYVVSEDCKNISVKWYLIQVWRGRLNDV